VLIDDVGFGASSVFGGPCETPNFERLANGGLRYNRFHTTALCAPSRAAMLTGRNHHSVGMGGITEVATSAPGNNSLRPAWPTGSGFEYFYGFIGGEDNQWYPALYEGTSAVEPPKTPEGGYHLTEDLADHAIGWVRSQNALMPDKPFFMYFAPGATHAPHHVPKEWIDRYQGQFAHGWDRQRELIFARQKELGVIPADAGLTERHAEIPAWDDMAEELKPVLEREMEIYAGFMSHTDHHVGRLLDAIEQLGVMDNTLIYVIIGDNGASAEGTHQGSYNEMINFNAMGALEAPEFRAERLDKFAGPESYNHYAVGWAWAMDTPFQWTKQVASHWGGTRNGTIVHWPNGIEGKGELRSQFCHIIDVAPNSFDSADAPERHDLQYFEMFGNRGVYFRGWSAVTKHRTPWELGAIKLPAFDDDVWELYDGTTDYSQAHDLSKEQPDKLHELQRLWLIEATKYNVIPLDDRTAERVSADIAGRPQLIKGDTQVFYPGMIRLSENSVMNIKNKSSSVTAEVVAPEEPLNGTIIAQGGDLGGYAKGGTVSLYYDGQKVGEGRVGATQPFIFSADEGLDIGRETGTAVAPECDVEGSVFTGQINWVELKVGDDDHSHLIEPEEHLQVLMARQ